MEAVIKIYFFWLTIKSDLFSFIETEIHIFKKKLINVIN